VEADGADGVVAFELLPQLFARLQAAGRRDARAGQRDDPRALAQRLAEVVDVHSTRPAVSCWATRVSSSAASVSASNSGVAQAFHGGGRFEVLTFAGLPQCA
jgi:hypothetical protein